MLLSHLKSGFQEVGDAGFETNELTNILIASTHIEIWRKVANQDLCGCFMLQFQKLHLFNFYDIDIPIFNNMNMGDFAKLTTRVSNSSNRIKLSNCSSVNFYEPMPFTFLIQSISIRILRLDFLILKVNFNIRWNFYGALEMRP